MFKMKLKYFNPINFFLYLKRKLIIRSKKLASKITQTYFMGCEVLVNSNEDVGINILVDNYENDDIEYFLNCIKSKDVIFDIGANIGIYSIIAGKKWPDVKIFAFEPVPINAQFFNTSLVMNDISNVRLIQKCVSNSSGDVDFSVSSDSAYSSMIDTRRKPELSSIKCEAVRVDEFCSEFGIRKIDVVKIDVEGAEELVILGAGKFFSDPALSPRLILIELFDENLLPFATSVPKILNLMIEYGYSPFILIGGQKTSLEKRHYNKYYNVFFEKN
jgi:FkbM family methyltransferase